MLKQLPNETQTTETGTGQLSFFCAQAHDGSCEHFFAPEKKTVTEKSLFDMSRMLRNFLPLIGTFNIENSCM